jgi:hypothetical protein
MEFIRFILVLACMSPLFILLAIRGMGSIPFVFYFPACLFFAIAPNLYLLYRIYIAKKNNDRKNITIHAHSDNKDQLLTYIFAMLIPLYQASFSSINDLYAALCALIFVIYIFYHMELYYMNFWFALFDYRVLTIEADPSTSIFSTKHVLITKKKTIIKDSTITPLRITDFLLFDK